MDNVRVLATGLRFPEGPTFDHTGCLWCVEQEGEGLVRRTPDGQLLRVHTGGRPNGAVYREQAIWFCDSGYNAIRRLDLDTMQVDTVLSEIDGSPLNMPNDLLFDASGNLIFTCPGPEESGQPGSIGLRTPDGQAELLTDGLMYPNGLVLLAVNPQALLVAETHRQRIWCGFWDEISLTWETIRVWTTVVEAPDGELLPGPDGMAVGPDGNVYVAVFGLGAIRVFSQEGQFIREIQLPGKRPTNCIFDPSGELGLVVTETERGELLSIK